MNNDTNEIEQNSFPKKTILVVDDEKMILQILILLLKNHYNIISLDNVSEFDSSLLSKIDLMIVDLFMPEMMGTDFVKQIHKTHSEIPVIFISGHLKENLSLLPPNAIYLEKPFPISTLIQTVHEYIPA